MARFTFEDSGLPPDLLRLVDAFDEQGARYVVVGGMAMVLHGTTHVTLDTDLAIGSELPERQAVARALIPLNPEPTHLPKGQKVVWDERSIQGAVVGLRTLAGDVDLMLVLPGADSFEGLYERAITIELSGRRIKAAAISDLISMKRVAARPKDLDHIVELERHEREG